MQKDEIRAIALRDQVMKTWNPPRMGSGGPAAIAQTSVMQTLAWCFGKPFLGPMTPTQERAIDLGLELMTRELDGQ